RWSRTYVQVTESTRPPFAYVTKAISTPHTPCVGAGMPAAVRRGKSSALVNRRGRDRGCSWGLHETARMKTEVRKTMRKVTHTTNVSEWADHRRSPRLCL